PEAFALVLDDKNVAGAGANPPHVEELFNSEAVPFLDGEKHRRRKRLLMRAFAADALEEYLPTIEQVIDRYANRWAGLGRFAWVPELNAMGFAIAGSLFIGADPQSGDPRIEAAFDRFAAGLLSLPLRLPFTPFTRALQARKFLLGLIELPGSPRPRVRRCSVRPRRARWTWLRFASSITWTASAKSRAASRRCCRSRSSARSCASAPSTACAFPWGTRRWAGSA